MLKEFLKEMKNIIAKKIPKKTCIAMYLFCPKNIGSEFMEIFLSSSISFIAQRLSYAVIQHTHAKYINRISKEIFCSTMAYEIGKDKPKVNPKNNCGIGRNLFVSGQTIINGAATSRTNKITNKFVKQRIDRHIIPKKIIQIKASTLDNVLFASGLFFVLLTWLSKPMSK